jgi:large subunit ribosomal protein L24e
MVVKRQCSFCAQEIEPGTGSMFVKRDGTVFHFCSGSCRKQQLHLGRVGHRFKWTRAHALKKAADRSSAAARSQAPAAPPHRARGRTRGPVAGKAAPTPEPAPPASAPPTPAAEAPPTAAPAKPPAKPRAKPRKKTPPPAADA